MVSDIFWRDMESKRLNSQGRIVKHRSASGNVAHARRYLNEEFEAVQRYLSMIDVPLRERTLDGPDASISAHPDSPQM